MKRISEPLEMMNANILTNNGCMPLEIKGRDLNSGHIEKKFLRLKSNQVLF